MPDNSYKDGLTPFANFREVTDHIWKYHSFLLSCERCDHRFLGAKRGESHRSALEKLKKEHWDKDCRNTRLDPDHSLKTMTDDQDKRLKSWKCTNTKDGASVKPNYESLCHSLFGSGIYVPPDQKWDYYIPKYTIDELYSKLGEMNLKYVRQNQPAGDEPAPSTRVQLIFSPYNNHPPHLQTTINPLLLDECHQPCDWRLPTQKNPDQDSAYGSGGIGESARQQQQQQQQTSGGVLSYTDADNLNWHQFSAMGFSQDQLDDPRPSSIVDENWELLNSDLPPG
ncbi:hypothetical protein F5Y08DRAFT_337143 [Xylaria arbuscula]|nr:hypothetical protein F5Y08DRAFT_337143 [Xylaria arbuscula]